MVIYPPGMFGAFRRACHVDTQVYLLACVAAAPNARREDLVAGARGGCVERRLGQRGVVGSCGDGRAAIARDDEDLGELRVGGA